MTFAPPLEVLDRIDLLLKDHGIDEIDTVIANINKEKSRINAQLKLEGDNRLKDFDSIMNTMKDNGSQLQELKLNVSKLDELQKDNLKDNLSNFNVFDEAIIVMNNISAVERIRDQMTNFERDKIYVDELLETELKLIDDDLNDDGDRFVHSNGNNFLIAHYQLNKLMDFGDQLKDKKSKIPQTEDMISKISNDLNMLSKKFDVLLENIVDNIYELYLSGNFEYLIKTIKIIEYEEKEDLKVKVWKSLVDEKNDSTINYKITRSTERGYRIKFMEMIKSTIQDKIMGLTENEKDPFKACQLVVNKMLPDDPNDPIAQANANSYYDILTVYREASRKCAPSQWKLFFNILEWCQIVIRDVIVKVIDSGTYTDDLIGKIIHLNLDNKSRLMKTMNIPSSVIKMFSFLPEDRKKMILNERLNTRKVDLQKHVENLLKRDTMKFRELCANGNGKDEFGSTLNVAGPLMSLLNSHFGLINQLHDECINIEFLNFFANEVLKHYCDLWNNCIMEAYQKFISGEETVSYYPEQLSILSVYFSKLADEFEMKFEITQLSQGGILLKNLDTIFNNSDSLTKIEEITDISIKNAITITIDCLRTYAQVTIHDVDMLFNELFKKDWYNEPSLIDKILGLISENSFEPFKSVIEKQSSVPDEVMHGLLDKFIEEFILRYLQSLNNRNKVNKNIDKAIQRDLDKITGFLQYYAGGDTEDEAVKLLVLEFVQSLFINDNYEELWVDIVDSISTMPIDLLRIILECKKEKHIDSIVTQCQNISLKVVGNNSKEFDFLSKFTYQARKK